MAEGHLYELDVATCGTNIRVGFALDLLSGAGKHCGRDITNLFFKSLSECDLFQKIQAITLGNTNVKIRWICRYKILENSHLKCFAHVINLGVQEFLKMVGKIPEDESYENQEDEEFTGYEDLENIVYRIRTSSKKFIDLTCWV